jgi:hypothetical protein
VLLVPDGDERGFKPAAHGAKAMDASVASGTKGDQQSALMDPRTSMMDGQFTVRPTPLTAAAVADEHGFALAGKAKAGMRLAEITGATES